MPYQSPLQQRKKSTGNYDSIPRDLRSNPFAYSSRRVLIHAWKLNGGDPINELKSQNLIHDVPKIQSLPLCFVSGCEVSRLSTVVPKEGELLSLEISLDKLAERIKSSLEMDYEKKQINIQVDYLKQSDEFDFLDPESSQDPSLLGVYSLTVEEQHAIERKVNEMQGMPLKTKEIDVEYQFHRIMLFQRLLLSLPETLPLIIKEAKKDVPPYCRAEIWAAILGAKKHVEGWEDYPIDYSSPIYRQVKEFEKKFKSID